MRKEIVNHNETAPLSGSKAAGTPKKMVKRTKGLKLLLTLPLLLAAMLLPQAAMAQCSWGIKVKEGSMVRSDCPNSGGFTIELTGDATELARLSDVNYSITELNVLLNSSPAFSNIPVGKHKVEVTAKCNNSSLETKTIEVVVLGDTYVPPALVVNLTRNSLGCTGALGRATVNLSGNSKPYTINITEYPEEYKGPFTFSTDNPKYMIDNMPSGTYSFQLVDRCGASTQKREQQIKTLTFTQNELAYISSAFPGHENKANSCNIYTGQPPIFRGTGNPAEWDGFDTDDTPFEYAISFVNGVYTEYKKMNSSAGNEIRLPLPGTSTFKDYYGKSDFLTMKIRICATEIVSKKISYDYTQFLRQTVETSVTQKCKDGFTRNFLVRYANPAICYPLKVELFDSKRVKRYTGEILASGVGNTITTPTLPFGDYTATYTTKDGGVLNLSFSNPAPSQTPYSIYEVAVLRDGLNNRANFITIQRENSSLSVGTTLTLKKAPAGYTKSYVTTANEAKSNKISMYAHDKNSFPVVSDYWPAGDYEWEIKDECGTYALSHTIKKTDLYNYTMRTPDLKNTCKGLVVTPKGEVATDLPVRNIFFKVYKGPDGYPPNTIQPGESFTFQASGTYKIGMSCSNIFFDYGDKFVAYTTVVYDNSPPEIDPYRTIGFVCIGEAKDKGEIHVTANKGLAPYTYYLHDKNGLLITSNNTGIFPNSLGLKSGDTYTVKVKDYCGASAPDQGVTILDLSTASLIITNKEAFCEGETLDFRAIALPNPTYQWYYNGVAIPGETNSKLTISKLSVTHAGTYKVVIQSGSCKNASTKEVKVKVSKRPDSPEVEIGNSYCAGTSVKVTIKSSLLGMTYNLYDAANQLLASYTGTGSDKVIDLGVVASGKTSYSLAAEPTNIEHCESNKKSFEITVTNAITLKVELKPAVCAKERGGFTAEASGGESPYKYSIDGQTWQTSSEFTNLAAGDYTLEVKDKNACTKSVSVKVVSEGIKPVIHSDIRVQCCPLPDRTLNLSSYLDTLHFISVSWINANPASDTPMPMGQEGQVNTGAFGEGTHKYLYKVKNTCSEGYGALYLSRYNQAVGGTAADTIVVCKDFANSINLKQLFGLEAPGTWSYHSLLKPYIVAATGQVYAGAMFFNGTEAYGAAALSAFEKPYKGDPHARQFEITYTAAPTGCMVGREVKRVIIITSTLF